MLGVGCWLLVGWLVGWLLVVGCWLLVVGCWFLKRWMDPEGGECYVVGDDDAAAAVAAKKKTKTKKRGRQMVCCDKCRLGITTVGEVFTVPCAGGTTGNYVNEGGFVHQTMTLRRVKR